VFATQKLQATKQKTQWTNQHFELKQLKLHKRTSGATRRDQYEIITARNRILKSYAYIL